ncbi:MAG: isopentenyl-diphosphate Delta-isomerase [Hyphomicrobium sp.]|nr:isopentenyl-diphosphate Delta-isomerase [Hyphomicrobium sp.]
MTNEFVILVDDTDRETGVAEKLDAHRRGALHRAFSIIIWDAAGRMLLQQRAASKYHSGGLWTNTCCGHPRPGEDVHAAASRRLVEEMGLNCPLTPLGSITYRAEFDNGLIEHEIVHVFRGLHDGAVTPNPDEADGYSWRTLDDVRRDVDAAPNNYSVWFRQYVAAEWPTAMERPSA